MNYGFSGIFRPIMIVEDSLLELKKKQEDELKNYFIDFEKNYPTDIKPSNELIEKQKQLDYYIKTEE